MFKRHNKKWGVNELIALQREYELLKWDIQEIATKHERSIKSILFKLKQEGFIDNWNSAKGFDKCNLNEIFVYESNDSHMYSLVNGSISENDTTNQNEYTLNEDILFRIEMLEKNVFDLKIVVSKLLNETTQLKNQSNFQL
jgi:hypothetical protein